MPAGPAWKLLLWCKLSLISPQGFCICCCLCLKHFYLENCVTHFLTSLAIYWNVIISVELSRKCLHPNHVPSIYIWVDTLAFLLLFMGIIIIQSTICCAFKNFFIFSLPHLKLNSMKAEFCQFCLTVSPISSKDLGMYCRLNNICSVISMICSEWKYYSYRKRIHLIKLLWIYLREYHWEMTCATKLL